MSNSRALSFLADASAIVGLAGVLVEGSLASAGRTGALFWIAFACCVGGCVLYSTCQGLRDVGGGAVAAARWRRLFFAHLVPMVALIVGILMGLRVLGILTVAGH